MWRKHDVIHSPTQQQSLTEPASDPLRTFRQGRSARFLRKLGIAGFLFFLIKGLLWLVIPALYLFFRS